MNNYLILSNTGNINGGKRIRWVANSYVRPADPAQVVRKNLQGTHTASFGVAENGWAFDAQFPQTGDGTYAGYSDVLSWIEGTTASQRALKIQDIDGTVYTAFLSNKPAIVPKSRDYTAAASLWIARFELVKQ